MSLIWSRTGAAVQGPSVIFDNKVYYGDFSGIVRAVEAKNGSLIWENSIGLSVPGALSLDKKSVFAPALQMDGISRLVKLDRETGKIKFQVAPELNDPTVTLELGSIVVDDACTHLVLIGTNSSQFFAPPPYTFKGGLYAFDKHTGELIWRFLFTQANALEGAGASAGFCAAVDKKRRFVYIGTGNAYDEPPGRSASLFGLNYRTKNPNGELVWFRQFTPNAVFSRLFPNGKDYDVGQIPHLFSVNDKDLVGISDKSAHYYAMDCDNGKLIWQTLLIPQNQNPAITGSPSGCVGNNAIYVPANYDPNNLSLEFFRLLGCFKASW